MSLTGGGTPYRPSVDDLRQLAGFARLKAQYPAAVDGVLGYLAGSGAPGAAATLAPLFGWNESAVQTLLDANRILDVFTATSWEAPAFARAVARPSAPPPYGAALTVEAWFASNTTRPDGENVLLGVWHEADDKTVPSFVVAIDAGGRVVFTIGGAPTAGIQPTVSIASRQTLPVHGWHHVAAVLDPVAAALSLYLDGEFQGSVPAAITPVIAAGDTIALGQDPGAGASRAGYANSLAEVRLWNVARGAADIQANMRRRFSPREQVFGALCGNWTFEGGKVADLTNRWEEFPQFPANTHIVASSGAAPALIAANINFTGAPPYATPLTVEALVSTTMVAPIAENVLFGVRHHDWSFVFRVEPAGTLAVEIGDQADGGEDHLQKTAVVRSTVPLAADTLHHVAAVVNAGRLTLYLDGVKAGHTDTAIVPGLSSGDNIDLGQTDAVGPSLEGYVNRLAEVRLWKAARTPAELIAGRDSRIAPASAEYAKLCGYWTFEKGSIADSIGVWTGASIPNGGVALIDQLRFTQLPVGVCLVASSADAPACVTATRLAGTAPYAQALTVEAWVSTTVADDATATANTLLGVRGTEWSFAFQSTAGGDLTFLVGGEDAGGASRTFSVTVAGALPPNRWRHVAGVFDGTKQKLMLYVDGVMVGESDAPLTGGLTAGTTLDLGQDDRAGDAAKGVANSIGELRLWSAVRSAEEIANNARCRITAGSTAFATLCGYWPFENGSLVDQAGVWTHDAVVPNGGVVFAIMPGAAPFAPLPFATIMPVIDAMAFSTRTGLSASLCLSLFRDGLILGADGAQPLVEAAAALNADNAAVIAAAVADLSRDALTQFAIPQINALTAPAGFPVTNTSDLSDYLLIDVEMAPGTATSRTVQATLSLQQYIQRCRLGLEPGAATPAITDQEWDWIRTYRTWEANRKVFLYPETYLRPELRNDVSALFAAFQQGLANTQPTRTALEQLYRRYLDGFAEVANLAITGAWFAPGTAIEGVLTSTSLAAPAYVSAQLGRVGPTPPWTALTAEAWVCFDHWPSDAQGTNGLFGLFDSGFFTMAVDPDGCLIFAVKAPGGAAASIASPAPLRPGTWYHVAGVIDPPGIAGAGSLRLYVDGVRVATTTTHVTPGCWVGDHLYLGQAPAKGGDAMSAQGMANSLAEVRLWNGARTQQQIQAAMRARLSSASPDWPSLSGYWSFEGGDVYERMGLWISPVVGDGTGFAAMAPPLDPTAPPDRYHVVGRSRSQPRAYHVRTLEVRTGEAVRWSSWQPVPVSIAADVATPIVSGGQLYLFWVEFQKVDANTQGTNPVNAHYRATIKFTRRNADGSWLGTQAPFGRLDLESDATSYLNPLTTPPWQQVFVAPTVTDGAEAIVVVYGAQGQLPSTMTTPSPPTYTPFCFTLNWDLSVSPNLSLVPDPAHTYAALGTAPGGSITGLWAMDQQSVLTAAGLAPASGPAVMSGTYLLVTGDNGGLSFSATGTGAPLASWPVATGFDGQMVLTAVVNGSLFAVVWDGSVTALYENSAPLSTLGGWTCVNLNLGASADMVPTDLFVYADQFYCAFTSLNLMQIVVLQAGTGSPGGGWTWSTISSSYELVGMPSLSVDAGGDLYCFYWIDQNDVTSPVYSVLNQGQWSAPAVANGLPPCSIAFSSCLSVGNAWYMVCQGGPGWNEQKVGLYTASALAGPWTLVGDMQVAAQSEYLLSISLLAVGTTIYCAYAGAFTSNQALLSTTNLAGNSWTALDAGGTLLTNLVALPIAGLPATQILTSLPADAAVMPVGNRIGAWLLQMGADALMIEATDPLTGAVRAGQLVATANVTAGTLGLAAADPHQLASSDFVLRRLSSAGGQPLIRALATGGVEALLAAPSQQTAEFAIVDLAAAAPAIQPPANALVSSSLADAYGLYYREIFCFVPWLIAERLQAAGLYQDARDYLEYLFKPTAALENDGCWPCQWFAQVPLATLPEALEVLDPAAMAAYEDDPFDAGAIADLRPSAYQRAIVTAYVQNLIAWGDDLFTQNTRETIDEADQLYRYAVDVLGPRPQLKPYTAPAPQTYATLRNEERNAFLYVLEALDAQTGAPAVTGGYDPASGVIADAFYFGIPDNADFLSIWDTLADRLDKIRNGLDITGKADDLPLFAPELSVGAIQQMGRSGSAAAAESAAAVHLEALEIEFANMLISARTLAATVVDYGRSLQQTLEMKDADGLFVLQTTQQIALADQLRQIRVEDVRSAQATLASLQAALQSASGRQAYYGGLQSAGLLGTETAAMALSLAGLELRSGSADANELAVAAWWMPTIFGLVDGGESPGGAIQAEAASLSDLSTIMSESAGLANTLASYERRAQDWRFQAQLAAYDVTQLNAQVAAATHQANSLQQQFALEQQSFNQAQAVQSYYANKFSSGQLYSWLADTLTALYQQFYQIAVGSVQSLQATLSNITGVDQQFVTTSGWNAQWRGLLAGETLQLDIARIEQAFNQWYATRPPDHARKTFSLRAIDPLAFNRLATTGTAEFDLSEALFDEDHPGHYLRTVDGLRVRLPGLAPAAAGLNLSLTRLSHDTVRQPDEGVVRFLIDPTRAQPAPGLRRMLQPRRASLVLETAADGLETAPLHAFDGGGVVSRWRIEAPPEHNRVDLGVLRDVEIVVDYRARYGGDAFRRQVAAVMAAASRPRLLMIDVARDHPRQWAAQAQGQQAQAGSWQIEIAAPRDQLPRPLPGKAFQAVRLGIAVADVDAKARGWLTLEAAGETYRVELDGRPSPGADFVLPARATAPLLAADWRLSYAGEAAAAIATVVILLDVAEG